MTLDEAVESAARQLDARATALITDSVRRMERDGVADDLIAAFIEDNCEAIAAWRPGVLAEVRAALEGRGADC